jgi:FkbM family methyltransferase
VRRLVGLSRTAVASLNRGRTHLPAGVLDCTVATNEHGAYCVPRSSRRRPAAQAILQARVYEPDTIDFLRGVDPASDIVHAGTFFGDFLPALARSRSDGAIVWAFEPNLESYRCAQVTTLLNDLPNVVLTHAALGADAGTAVIVTSNRAGVPLGGGSHVIEDASSLGDGASHERVRLASVDDTVAGDRRVGVIQLDVEGHEQPALAGAMRTIERCLPVIVLEAVPQSGWVAEHLEPLGYEAGGLVGGNRVLRCS